MLKATVIGPVWATKRLSDFPSGALLEVEDQAGQRHVALDQLGSGPGEQVLIALGSAVARHLPGNTPTDALVVGLIDEETSPAQGGESRKK